MADTSPIASVVRLWPEFGPRTRHPKCRFVVLFMGWDTATAFTRGTSLVVPISSSADAERQSWATVASGTVMKVAPGIRFPRHGVPFGGVSRTVNVRRDKRAQRNRRFLVSDPLHKQRIRAQTQPNEGL